MAHNELVRALCVRLTEVMQLQRGAGLPAEYTQAADLALADAEHALPPGEPLRIITPTNEIQSIVNGHLSDVADAETRAPRPQRALRSALRRRRHGQILPSHKRRAIFY
jgi:hypothetical protein